MKKMFFCIYLFTFIIHINAQNIKLSLMKFQDNELESLINKVLDYEYLLFGNDINNRFYYLAMAPFDSTINGSRLVISTVTSNLILENSVGYVKIGQHLIFVGYSMKTFFLKTLNYKNFDLNKNYHIGETMTEWIFIYSCSHYYYKSLNGFTKDPYIQNNPHYFNTLNSNYLINDSIIPIIEDVPDLFPNN